MASLRATQDSIRALMLIRAYRVMGHLAADLDPLGLTERKIHKELRPETYGFTDADLDRPIFIDKVLGLEIATVRDILKILRRTYCRQIGVEFMHITSPAQKSWIQERIEGRDKDINFTVEGKRAILNKLIEAETFERFADVKYTGTKRFGLDGGEAMVPALEQIIKRGGQLGVKEIVMGMAHRGRLNVLANVMAKPHRAIFNEFKGGSYKPDDVEGSGDVKYHLGASSDRSFDGNNVHLSLTANPSHLEIVDPVVLGKVRAKQDQHGCKPGERTTVMPLLIHGDAAFAGQGVVAECFGLSGLKGHRTGGSIHFIINNQIGFTTSPRHSRSSPYCSDVAKMVEAPIFHVNGDNPEAVVHVAKIATEFRQRFQKPVVIDMFCYRRHGHNESDEPAFTQPLMYRAIKAHPTRGGDLLQAAGRGGRRHRAGRRGDAGRSSARTSRRSWPPPTATSPTRPTGSTAAGPRSASPTTRRGAAQPACRSRRSRRSAGASPPSRRTSTPTRPCSACCSAAARWWRRAPASIGRWPSTWRSARCSRRASRCACPARTASAAPSRSATPCWSTRRTSAATRRSSTSRPTRAASRSSTRCCRRRRCWPSSTATRWPSPTRSSCGRRSSATSPTAPRSCSTSSSPRASASGCACRGSSACCRMATRGRGRSTPPRGSSASCRSCAEDNWQVANCTTPANYFHILRRQLHRKFRKPLVIMTPKSLLRHKRVTSDLAEMGPGTRSIACCGTTRRRGPARRSS